MAEANTSEPVVESRDIIPMIASVDAPLSASPDTRSGHHAMQEILEAKEQEPSLRDRVIEIAMRLDYEEITEDEAAVELAIELNERNVPMTRAVLQFLRIKNFTFTNECGLQRLNLLTRKQKEWMSIEKECLPDGGAKFFIEEFGNEMIGTLQSMLSEAGQEYFLCAPDKKLYPLNALALVQLKKKGGALANIGKTIIAKVTVLNGLHLYVTKVVS